MVVPETMDDELDLELNPETVDDAMPIGVQDDAKEDGDPSLTDELEDNDLESGSKEKTQNVSYSPTKEEKRLVLEARHSLSIAETKKRRASVYSSESLFIPKELARSDILHRRGSTLEKIDKHQECCMRMLTFPVGSGRARYVAKQMKKGKRIVKKQTPKVDEEPKVEENVPRNMPDLDIASAEPNQLQSDDEMSILLLDMVKDLMKNKHQECKDDQDAKLSDNSQSQRTSVIKINRKLLAEEKDQQNILFRWHNPNYCDGEIKMRLMDKLNEMKAIPETEVQVNYSEVNNERPAKPQTVEHQQHHHQQQEQEERLPVENENELQSHDTQQQYEQNESLQQQPEQFQIQIQPQMELQNPLNADQQPFNIRVVAAERHQQHAAHIPIIRTAPTTSNNNPTTDPLVRQQLMQRIIYANDDLYQSNNNNNNALNLIKRNSYASEPSMNQWPPQQSYSQQPHRQSPPLIYQQHQLEPINQLQELKAMHQRLKIQEDEQLNQIGNTLKKVYEERSICERQHAEEKRLFLQKMSQSQKLEEKLQADREQLQRQHKADLSMLEQRIGEKQRQLQNLNWQRQQQTYQQQLMIEQQHFIQQQQIQQQQQHQQHLLQTQQVQQPQPVQQHRLAQQQHARQQLATQHQIRRQINQQEHPPTFYPSHTYETHRPQPPPPAYKPHPPPYQAAPNLPPVPAAAAVAAVRDVQQLSNEARHSIAMATIEDQRRLLPPPSIYLQPGQAAASLLASSHRPSENDTCQSARAMRRRHIIDHRTLPYGPIPATQTVQANLANPQRYPTEVPSAAGGQIQEQNINRTAITSLIQNYVSNFINDNLRPNG